MCIRDRYEDFSKAEKIMAFINPLMQFCMYLTMLLIAWFGARAIVASGNNAALGLSTGELKMCIRDSNYIGSMSKTDVAISYMKDKVDKELLARLEKQLKNLDAENLTVGDQSLLERLMKSVGAYSKVNPFPKVRYSQRPDIISAPVSYTHLTS